jgi:hypothetical protein
MHRYSLVKRDRRNRGDNLGRFQRFVQFLAPLFRLVEIRQPDIPCAAAGYDLLMGANAPRARPERERLNAGKKAMADIAPAPRYARRLSDKIFIAFHHACDQHDIEIAGALLDVLEFMAVRRSDFPAGADRRANESFVAAHERLWQIRHPESDEWSG